MVKSGASWLLLLPILFQVQLTRAAYHYACCFLTHSPTTPQQGVQLASAQASSSGQIPTLTFASAVEPPSWSYIAPAGLDVIWFEAQQTLPSGVVPPILSDYVTSPGGSIVDVVPTSTSNMYLVRGYVPALDPFTSNTTLVQLSTSGCALAPSCTATLEAANAPQCNVYAVDMAYCGTEGLVTDRDTALLVLVCSEAVTGLCSPAVEDCILVDGPANGTVSYVDVIAPTNNYYHVQISWDPDYLGPVMVSFECDLESAEGTGLLVEAIQPLEFVVTSIVAVRSSAYRIGNSIVSVAASPSPEPEPDDRPA